MAGQYQWVLQGSVAVPFFEPFEHQNCMILSYKSHPPPILCQRDRPVPGITPTFLLNIVESHRPPYYVPSGIPYTYGVICRNRSDEAPIDHKCPDRIAMMCEWTHNIPGIYIPYERLALRAPQHHAGYCRAMDCRIHAKCKT